MRCENSTLSVRRALGPCCNTGKHLQREPGGSIGVAALARFVNKALAAPVALLLRAFRWLASIDKQRNMMMSSRE